jgi:predicted ferric reductase
MKRYIPLFIIGGNLLVILGFWASSSGADVAVWPTGTYTSLGRLFGLLLAFGALLQVLLIGRLKWIERVFGHDRLARLHHVTGFSLLAFLVLHPFFIIQGYRAVNGLGFIPQYFDIVTNYEEAFKAGLAFWILMGIVSLSVPAVRKRLKYEVWYGAHLFVYVAVLLAFGHQLELGQDFAASDIFRMYWWALYAFVFGNWAYFRAGMPAYRFWHHRFRVSEIRRETEDTVSIYIEGDQMEEFPKEAGQFIIVRFLDRSRWWQAHPFSLSAILADGRIRITPKAVGDFTRALPEVLPGTPVVIDGPHGIFTPSRTGNRKILLIAGGVGITPIRSLAEAMVREGRDIVLLYGSKNEAGIIFRKELEELAATARLRIVHVLSDDPSWAGEKGHVNAEKLIRLVSDLRERDAYVCGPKPMILGVTAALQGLGVPRDRVYSERFAL